MQVYYPVDTQDLLATSATSDGLGAGERDERPAGRAEQVR